MCKKTLYNVQSLGFGVRLLFHFFVVAIVHSFCILTENEMELSKHKIGTTEKNGKIKMHHIRFGRKRSTLNFWLHQIWSWMNSYFVFTSIFCFSKFFRDFPVERTDKRLPRNLEVCYPNNKKKNSIESDPFLKYYLQPSKFQKKFMKTMWKDGMMQVIYDMFEKCTKTVYPSALQGNRVEITWKYICVSLCHFFPLRCCSFFLAIDLYRVGFDSLWTHLF